VARGHMHPIDAAVHAGAGRPSHVLKKINDAHRTAILNELASTRGGYRYDAITSRHAANTYEATTRCAQCKYSLDQSPRSSKLVASDRFFTARRLCSRCPSVRQKPVFWQNG